MIPGSEVITRRLAISTRLREIERLLDQTEGELIPDCEDLLNERQRLEIDYGGFDFEYFSALREDPFRRGPNHEDPVSMTSSVVTTNTQQSETSCPRCRQEMGLVNEDGYLVCERCFATRPAPYDADSGEYSDDRPKHSPPYRKITYFDTWMEYLESTNWVNIPPEVLDDIRREERNLMSGDLKTVPPIKIRDWLGKHGHSQYYKNVPQIYSMVTGLPPVKLSRETKMQARKHFLRSQGVWRDNFTKESNMSGYATIVAKILESIGFPQYAAYFPKIKHEDLNRNANKRWDFIAGRIGLSDQIVPCPSLTYYNKQKKPPARAGAGRPRSRR